MQKLVRDRIKEIIEKKGEHERFKILEGDEFVSALKDKLVEESLEVQAAKPDELLEELADVMEVIMTLAKEMGFSLEDIEMKRRIKAVLRGRFDKKLMLCKNTYI